MDSIALEMDPVEQGAASPAVDSTPLLLRGTNDSEAAAMLHGVAVRLAGELQKQLRQMGAVHACVAAQPVQAVSSRSWTEMAGGHSFWQVKPTTKAGKLALAVPRATLLQLVDIFYGGNGSRVAEREALSIAEKRFAVRYGDELAVLFAFAFRDTSQLAASFVANFRDGNDPLAEAVNGPLLVQDFAVTGAPLAGAVLRLACNIDSVVALTGASMELPVEPASEIDPSWMTALHRSLGNVTLPVTSILARPEISLVRMLSLQVGDIIPLNMPHQVPLTVAGNNVAYGTLGEVNGRVAISIAQIKKGNL